MLVQTGCSMQNLQSIGHIARFCKKKGEHIQQAQVAEDLEKPIENLFVVTHHAAEREVNTWLVDSGCSNHMTYEEKIFRDLDKSYASKVRVGNGAWVDVKGKGTININTSKGTKTISEVLCVPNLSQNLLSVG